MRTKYIAIVLLMIGLAAGAALADASIQVLVDGKQIAFDQPPIMQGQRVLVPLRGVFEQLGATVVYSPETRSITATRGADTIVLHLGSTEAIVRGKPMNLDVSPTLVGSRAMVPLRFISESLGATVHWIEYNHQVVIKSQATALAPPPPVVVAPVNIESVTVDTAGPVRIGSDVHVTLYGTQAGIATYDIGRHKGLPMRETSPGVYAGRYTVNVGDNEPQAVVTGHLEMPNGQHVAKEAPTTVGLGNAPIIFNVVHNGGRRMHLGGTLTVTMSGVPGGIATMDVGHKTKIQMIETSPGTYLGHYVVPLFLVSPSAHIVTHLKLPDDREQAAEAPPVVSFEGI